MNQGLPHITLSRMLKKCRKIEKKQQIRFFGKNRIDSREILCYTQFRNETGKDFYMLRAIKKRCIDCGKLDCKKKPLDECYLTETEGCTREVSEIDANRFFYYYIELLPQLLRTPNFVYSDKFQELMEFEAYIDAKPAGERWKRYQK